MPQVKRTIKVPGKPDEVNTYNIPLKSNVVGPYVTSKVIYDLRKHGRSEAKYDGGKTVTFEVV